MKILKLSTIATIATMLFVGCAEEKLPIDNTPDVVVENVGNLVINKNNIECRIDEQSPNTDAGVDAEATRASIDTSNFICKIYDKLGAIAKDTAGNELVYTLATLPQNIEMEWGDYILHIQSQEEIPAVAWATPVYGYKQAFTIRGKETTTISKIICGLVNIKVSLTYAADLYDRLSKESDVTAGKVDANGSPVAATFTTISVAGNKCIYNFANIDAGDAAFFISPEYENTLSIAVDAYYAADMENFKKVVVSKQYDHPVRAGQWIKIHLFLENADKGTISFDATIVDWITDEEITRDIIGLVTEPIIDDFEDDVTPTKDPGIIWKDHDWATRYAVYDGLKVDLVATASKGIKEFTVKIVSPTLTAEELAKNGLCDVMNLTYPEKSYDSSTGTPVDVSAALTGLGFPSGSAVINETNLPLSITTFMGVLASVSGTDINHHDFVLTLTDNEDTIVIETLKLVTGEGATDILPEKEDPSIVWVGNDISQRYPITSNTEVKLLVESTAGIKSFTVKIISPALTPAELSKSGLCDVMDLCYPENSYDSTTGNKVNIADAMRGLGFPVGDEVINQPSVPLDITLFMGAMIGVSSPTEIMNHDFEITVTDNNDVTTTKTLMLQTGN